MDVTAPTSICDTSCSWSTKKDNFKTVLSYTFLDISSCSSNVGGQDENGIGISCKSHDFPQQQGLELFQPDEGKTCDLLMKSNKPNHLISGVTVYSESRTLELCNVIDGYLATLQGSRLSPEGGDAIPSEQQLQVQPVFVCKCSLKEGYSSVSIKFLSLAKRKTFKVFRIIINISQDLHSISNFQGSINIKRLKKDVDEMGDSVSKKAKDFLSTMEQFEKNKLSMSSNGSGVPAMMMSTLMNSGSTDSGASHTNALAEMFSKFQIQRLNTHDEKVQNIGADASEVVRNGSPKDSDMFQMLQAVCGKVTEMRLAGAEHQSGAKEGEMEATVRDNITKKEEKLTSRDYTDLTIINNMVAGMKSEFRAELQAVKTEVMEKIDATQRQLGQKMDLIIKLLNEKNSV